jgi:tetratricopeptide (TPR) repeat protein
LKTLLNSFLLALLLASFVAAQASLSSGVVVVSYSFDDDNVATGPDTFRVFNYAKGNVNLTTTYCRSGYRSVELRDEAGDKDFPELQGYFPLRSKGQLFAHFAFMTTAPNEPLNMALAGTEWFTVRKDGIAFWLSSRDGFLYQHSGKTHVKLFKLEPFEWYTVELTYRIDEGTYDLSIRAEDEETPPLVSLVRQKNAAGQAASAVDKFSFIGDLEDKSNVTYYVDDVVISVDRRMTQKPLVAPGRRKLFVDRWNDYYKRMLQHPNLIPAIDLSDFGIRASELQSLRREGLIKALGASLNGRQFNEASLSNASPDNVRLLHSISLWMQGNEQLSKRQAEAALASFEAAARQVPQGKIYALSAVLALAALKRWEDVDAKLPLLYADWHGDVRFAVASAMIGLARGNLSEAERWLREPAALISTQPDAEVLRRLWSGQVNDALMVDLKQQLPLNWRQYVESWLVCEQYYFVLLWQKSFDRAGLYAAAMVERYQTLGLPTWFWRERAGDAAFYAQSYEEAKRLYGESLKENEKNTGVLLKLSDVYFVLGDLEKEQVYREKVYGTLSPNRF